jgi:hypothetical protein
MIEPLIVMSRNETGGGSSGLTMIVAEHSAESLTPSDCAVRLANVGERLQQPVSEPLMIALAVIVGHIVGERVPK